MSTADDGNAITGALVANVLDAPFDSIGKEVVENTKRRILDMIGNALAGARCDGNPELAGMVAGWGGKREATVLGYGTRVPIANAAFVNCVFGRSFDRGPLTYVVNGRRSPNHITETSALTAVAVGQSRRISGKDLIAAIVVGDDLAARLHLCIDRPQPGQSLPAGTPPPPQARGSEEAFAAAAIAGRIMGLSAVQLRNAFGIATMLSGGGMGVMGAGPESQGSPPAPGGPGAPPRAQPGWLGVKDPSFIATMERAGREDSEKSVNTKLGNGLSARNGINAVQLGRAGWPGVTDPFFGRNGGHFPGLASVHHPEQITQDLGREFIVEVCFKPYPGGRPTAAPTAAAIELARKNDVNTDEIREVILHLSPPATAAHYATPYVVGAYPTMNALWSYYFAVASALYRRTSTAENFTEVMIRDPKLQALIRKVKLGHLDRPQGIEVEVIMQDGRRLSEPGGPALGDPGNPLSREGLMAKFMEQVEFSGLVERDDAGRIIELVEGLEQVEDINSMTRLAGRRPGGPGR